MVTVTDQENCTFGMLPCGCKMKLDERMVELSMCEAHHHVCRAKIALLFIEIEALQPPPPVLGISVTEGIKSADRMV
jgi:hypothetical protein